MQSFVQCIEHCLRKGFHSQLLYFWKCNNNFTLSNCFVYLEIVMASKGQMFIVVGIVVALTLIILRTSIDFTKLIDNKKSMELGLERKEFINIRNEAVGTIDNSMISINSIISNTN